MLDRHADCLEKGANPPTTLQSIALTLLLGTLGSAWAGPKCTEEPQDKWLSAEKMTKIFTDLGYKDDVRKLHVSSGKCWEIYGHDREGKAVEIYFHPLTGAIVEANVKK